MKYTTKQIEEAANKLRALPAKKRSRTGGSKQAVQMLQAEFAALLERGYSLEQATRELRKAGIELSPLMALESLGRASRPTRKRTARSKTLELDPDEVEVSVSKRTPFQGDRPSAPPASSEGSVSKRMPLPPPERPSAPPSSSEISVSKRVSLPGERPSAPPPLAAPEPTSRRVLPPPLPPMPPPPQLQRAHGAPVPPPPTRPSLFQRGKFSLAKAAFQVRPDTPDSEL